jgi:hypothetical protein
MERDTAAATREIKVKPSMQIYNNSIEVTYGIPIMQEKASSREKARPRVAERVMGPWVEERNPPKNTVKTTSDGENMFETQERTIVWLDRARMAQKSAKNDHAWHEFVDLANKCLCLWWYLLFIGPQVFKTKPENDSDITRTSQPTCSRPVVCVGLITC